MADPLGSRVAGMILRGVVRAVSSATTKWRELQVEVLRNDVDEMEHAEPYGFTSEPLPPDATGAPEAIVLAVGGDRDHNVVIVCGDRRFRLTSLIGGEVALYDDQGQVFHLRRAEVLIGRAGANPINLGAGASRGVARIGDTVDITIPTAALTDTAGDTSPIANTVVSGTITSASGSVNAID